MLQVQFALHEIITQLKSDVLEQVNIHLKVICFSQNLFVLALPLQDSHQGPSLPPRITHYTT